MAEVIPWIWQEVFTAYQRGECIALTVLCLVLGAWLSATLWRKPIKVRLPRTTRAWMLIIALLPIEYTLYPGAWMMKQRWNDCLCWSQRFDRVDEQTLNEISKNEEPAAREWADACAKKKLRFRRLLWQPWKLLTTDMHELAVSYPMSPHPTWIPISGFPRPPEQPRYPP